MDKLIIFNCIWLVIIFTGLFFCKKYVKTNKTKNLIFFLSAILTIICHYSSFLYLCFTKGDALGYLKTNPNLLLPIYPCNVVMWGCLIFGIFRNKETKFMKFLADYLFWFGIFSTLVGMFANVDFINNPTFKDYEVTKSIVAHITLLFNVLLIKSFGYIKVNLFKNIFHLLIAIVMMYFIGLYCNQIFEVLVSYDAAYSVNSMFIIHSPFDGVPFLIYPVIALISIVLYIGLFSICELFAYPKGNRWISRIKKKEKLSEK